MTHITKLMNILFLFASGAMLAHFPVSAKEESTTEKVHESRYHAVFPLQKGGEKIDVLVRVKDRKRGYYFNLVFVEKRAWSKERKDAVYRLYQGRRVGDPEIVPYPVRLRLRLDSLDADGNVHIDEVIAKRSPLYGRYMNNDTEIWRSHLVHFGRFDPGVYRLRVDNLAPAPQIDFETLFGFERDTGKH